VAKVSAKQRRFVAEYLVDHNATQAAIRAGYSKRTARQQASDLLSKPDIAQALQEALAAQQKRLEVKADDVLRELMRIGLCDLGQAFDDQGRLRPLHEMPEDVRRAIAGIEVEEEYSNPFADLPRVTDDGLERDGGAKVAIGRVAKVRFWDKPKALELLGKYLKLFTEKHEHTGKDGGPIEHGSSPEQIEKVDALLKRLESALDAR
jgi:phage terminase small subunit